MGQKIVWIDEDLVGKVDLIQDICRLKGEDLDKIIEDLKQDDKLSLEGIDDTLIEIKHHAKKVRDEYKECADAEIEKTTELWEDLSSKVYENRTKLYEYQNEMDYLLQTIKCINEEINSIPFHNLERATEFIENFKSMNDKEKECLSVLVEKLK